MHEFAYDLHIHYCLSPCGDEDMTPANIAGMAALKGLDVIALTDHNSCKNCPAIMKAAQEYGISVIPGMELTTMEEVHVLCLFPELSRALDFDAYVYERLLPFPNREDLFGRQIIYNENDEPAGKVEYLLISSTQITFSAAQDIVEQFGGVMIPAHIDKNSNSLLHNLGFIPSDSHFTCAEVANLDDLERLKEENPYLNGCKIIHDSDAHYLEHIHEREQFLTAASAKPADVLEALTGKSLTSGVGVI